MRRFATQAADDCTAGTAFAVALVDLAQQLGVQPGVLATHAQLDAEVLAARLRQPNGRMPMRELLALCAATQALSRHPALGVELARRVRPATFNVLGYALMTCATLGEAIALIPHYRRLVFEVGYSETRFVTDEQRARLIWRVLPDSGLPYSPVLAEALLASWCAFGRWMVGSDIPLTEVCLAHAAGAAESAQGYGEFFGCPVRFEAGENALVFDAHLLAQPLLQADAGLHLTMRAQAQAALRRIDDAAGAAGAEAGLPARVRQALIPLMPKCEATLVHAAAALDMAPRSLQRHLEQAGSNFQALLDGVRRELACVYLRDPAMSMLDCALLLGYAEQSSFSRAFAGWFGCSPRQWRQRQA